MTKTKCAICGKVNSKTLYEANFEPEKINEYIFSARRLPDEIHYQIVKCKKCGLVYSNPILPLNKIEKFYKKSKYTYGIYEKDLSLTYSKYLNKFVGLLPSKENFLEIGCGNGFFLLKAKKLGFKNVFGVEPGKKIVAKADPNIKKNIIVDIFKKGQFKKNYFDVICLFQVLDHLPFPNEVLTECYRILKPAGG
ncbi:MAG: class I SAM-dependent methyltransferase, partial [Candidatus Omnitrophica bacterium]|nr:class I SAM-dependent methyltransferase [Candidatus Omnitrophota bacterium]